MQIPVAFNAFHCIPVRNTSKTASIAARSQTRRRSQPNGCTGRAGNNRSTRSHNQSGIRQPSSPESVNGLRFGLKFSAGKADEMEECSGLQQLYSVASSPSSPAC
jgi:hypothetical protein